MDQKPIVFFDGHCNLCNGFIRFLVDRDKEHHFYIASLQGKTSHEILPVKDRESLESMVLWENGIALHRSRAVFAIARRLGGWFRLISFFSFLPTFITDSIYKLVARYRYTWFGRSDQCRLPTPEEKPYFLD